MVIFRIIKGLSWGLEKSSVFVGCAQNSKVYKLLDLIVECIHVEFIENKFIKDFLNKPLIEPIQNRVDAHEISHYEIVTNKKKSDDKQLEPWKGKSIRKEMYLGFDFISSQAILF